MGVLNFELETNKHRVSKHFDNEFEFICKKVDTFYKPEKHLDYRFEFPSSRYSSQLSFCFERDWVDAYYFITPTPKYVDRLALIEALNYLNGWLKTWGRLYIDDYNDIIYSQRFLNDIFKIAPEWCLEDLSDAISMNLEVFPLIIKVCDGELDIDGFKAEVIDLWEEFD